MSTYIHSVWLMETQTLYDLSQQLNFSGNINLFWKVYGACDSQQNLCGTNSSYVVPKVHVVLTVHTCSSFFTYSAHFINRINLQ